MLDKKTHDLQMDFCDTRRIEKKERLTHRFKACPSFRYRVVTIYENGKKIATMHGYYYTSGTDSPIGSSLFNAAFGKCIGDESPIIKVQIYQYVNRHEIDGIPSDQLYHSFSTNYDGGLYYRLIAEGTVEAFRKEYQEFLEHGIKKHPNIL